MTTIEDLEREIKIIQERNKKVEIEKRWETSLTRRVLLIVFTYLTIGFYLQAIRIPDAWLNAIVPALAFYFSTLTLPFFRNIWQKLQSP